MCSLSLHNSHYFSDKNSSYEGLKSLLNKINEEASQHKSNIEEESKAIVSRLLAVLESVTQTLIHWYPFEYEDGQEMLQMLWDTWRETLMVAESCAILER